jgi:hypothetical protein
MDVLIPPGGVHFAAFVFSVWRNRPVESVQDLYCNGSFVPALKFGYTRIDESGAVGANDHQSNNTSSIGGTATQNNNVKLLSQLAPIDLAFVDRTLVEAAAQEEAEEVETHLGHFRSNCALGAGTARIGSWVFSLTVEPPTLSSIKDTKKGGVDSADGTIEGKDIFATAPENWKCPSGGFVTFLYRLRVTRSIEDGDGNRSHSSPRSHSIPTEIQSLLVEVMTKQPGNSSNSNSNSNNRSFSSAQQPFDDNGDDGEVSASLWTIAGFQRRRLLPFDEQRNNPSSSAGAADTSSSQPSTPPAEGEGGEESEKQNTQYEFVIPVTLMPLEYGVLQMPALKVRVYLLWFHKTIVHCFFPSYLLCS